MQVESLITARAEGEARRRQAAAIHCHTLA